LLGQISEDKLVINPDLGILIACAVGGGLIGGYLGSSKMNNTVTALFAGGCIVDCYL
jgi:hypothetical protein